MTLALMTGAVACGGDDDNASKDESQSQEQSGIPPTTGTVSPPTTGTAATDPCKPFGSLTPGDGGLNDRCVPVGAELGPAFSASAQWGTPTCPDMVVVPEELIVAIGPSFAGTLDDALKDVVAELGALGIGAVDQPPFSEQAGIVATSGASFAQVENALSSLQRVGRSVDFNYLEPLQPNNGFRPDDDPAPPDEAAAQQNVVFGGADGKRVTVIDSPSGSAAYSLDVDGNGLVDEDNGHGVFVKSIIDRSGATVDLIGVPPTTVTSNNPSVLASGRWAPMMFSDAELIVALESVTKNTDVVNLSLGGVGCPMTEPAGGRLALARVMDTMSKGSDVLRFVAAAGNNGADVLHFPAAWRHPDVTAYLTAAMPSSPLVDFPDPRPGAVAPLFSAQEATDTIAEIEQMHESLAPVIYAVGSVEEDSSVSRDSNCGIWINAIAYGTHRLGLYPYGGGDALDLAVWSGTSFATANFTAAYVAGAFNNPAPSVAATAIDITGAKEVDGLDCPPPPTTSPTSAAP
jgi:hypothetical protein